MLKRLSVLAMTLLLILTSAAGAFAAEYEDNTENSAALTEARKVEIARKYSINILIGEDKNGQSCAGVAALDTLDIALENLTPAFVRQVSSYWQERTGKKLSYSFIYAPNRATSLGLDVAGYFDIENSVIEIYLPDYSENASPGGENPLTYLHEFGHAVQSMLTELHGGAALEREWGIINGEGIDYNFGEYPESYDESIWISAYASTRYEEDFAEVFAHAFLRYRGGLGFSSRLVDSGGKYTVLGKKAAYLEKLLKLYADNPDEVILNLRRLYAAPESITHNGLTLSGEYLQFSGYPAPGYILANLLDSMTLSPKSSSWAADIGGWQVITGDEKQLLLFPGGVYFEI